MSSMDRLSRIVAEEQAEPIKKRRPAPKVEEPIGDLPVFENGPLQSQVESWKRQYGEIFVTQFSESEIYVWHPLERYEYKQILVQALDPLQREEMIAEICVLWPQGFDYEAQARTKAGDVSTIAEQILDASNFRRDAIPQRL